LKPVRSCVNQRLPTLRIERDALDVATAPFVDDWHAVSFDLVRVEERLIVLRAMGQRECQHVRVPDQQAQNALGLLLAPKLGRLLASLLVPDPRRTEPPWTGTPPSPKNNTGQLGASSLPGSTRLAALSFHSR